MKKIPLTRGLVAIVDDEDYESLSRSTWHAVCRTTRATRYAARREYQGGGRKNGVFEYIAMHRQILGLRKGDGVEVDHINGDGLDNRRCNLRIATRAENRRNSGPLGGQSRFIGVCPVSRSSTWRAQIGHDGTTTHLGCFPSEEAAARAYDRAALAYFGEFARLNFPKETK